MHRGWRLLRQRGLRSRSGQVSAVATILALLLFVSFLSTFVLQPLDAQMTRLEVQHELQVEDQLSVFQNDIETEADSPHLPLYLNSPVTLGSLSNPPFGHGSSGSVAPTSAPVGSSVSIPQYSSPKWGSGNLCTATASGCGNSVSNQCTPPLDYNLSVNSSTFTFDLTGSSDCERLNITGNHDTITLEVTGSNLGYFVLTLFGSNDTLILNNQFSGSGFHAYFYLYGSYDTYETNGGPTGSGMYLSTYFIGESSTLTSCGISNLSATDHWSISGSSSSNSLQNLTWYNSVGYSTPYFQTSGWPGSGNSGTGDLLGWQNVSTPINCAFYKDRPVASALGGVAVSLNNLYSSPASVALDAGAVVFSAVGVDSVMVSPPPWTYSITQGVTTLSFTLFDFASTVAANSSGSSVVTGSQTADIQTFLLSESYVTLATGGTAVVDITTAYPTAWMTYFATPALDAVPSSIACIGSVQNCASPPAGKEVTVTAQFQVSELSFTVAVIAVSFV
jgi:hypothetical protein